MGSYPATDIDPSFLVKETSFKFAVSRILFTNKDQSAL